MKDFRQSKTFKPYRAISPDIFIGGTGKIETRPVDLGFRYGYMSQKFKAKLFGVAQESLQPNSEDSAQRLSVMANYLANINVENYLWMVGVDTYRDPEPIRRAMERMHDKDAPYDPINQADAMRYARFGKSVVKLVRVPGVEDEAAQDPTQIPMSMEITSSPGPEMILGFSETTIRTYYPLPTTFSEG